MTVYTWLVVLLVVASFIFKGNRRNSKIFILIAFLLLFAVMGLRDVNAFGNDTWGAGGSYPNTFQRIGLTDWNELSGKGNSFYNIGFYYFMKLIYVLAKGDYQVLIIVISLMVMVSYMRFIWKYSPSPIFSVLCFLGLMYYTFLFDALKQAMAMAVLLFAFDAIIKKRPIVFVILTVIASLFHFPALVFLPAYWIGRMQVGRKYVTLLAALLFLTFIFRNQLLNLMLNAYGDSENTATMAGVRFLRNKVIIMIAVAVFAVYIRPPFRKDTVYNAMMMFLGIAIILQTFCGYNNIFERLADYYFHTSIVLIPLIFETGGLSQSRVDTARNERFLYYSKLLICGLAIWRFLSTVNNSPTFNPYLFIWQR